MLASCPSAGRRHWLETAKVVPGAPLATIFVEETIEELKDELTKKTARDRDRAERRSHGSVTEYSLELTDSQNADMFELGKLHPALKKRKVDDLAAATQSELQFKKRDLHCGGKLKTKKLTLQMCSTKINARKAAMDARSRRRHSPR